MSTLKVTIHSTGSGICSHTSKEGDGLTVSFDDGTLKESFLSWRGFRQLLGLKSGREAKTGNTAASPASIGATTMK